jgi:hypothetical protein
MTFFSFASSGRPPSSTDGRRRTDPSSGYAALILLPQRRAPRVRRRRTISLSDGFLARRVRPSGLPHGETGWRPPEVLPSPPPSGWSTGFMATPRVWGRTPFQRLRPALPIEISSASELPTSPSVARQSIGRGASPSTAAAAWRSRLPWRRAARSCPRRGPSCRRRRAELDVVDDRTDRDVAHRQGVAGRMSEPCPDCSMSPTPPSPARGCSASRRRGSAAGRCGRCGWGRTRSPRPWPGRRPCHARSR